MKKTITKTGFMTLIFFMSFGLIHAQNAITVPYSTGFENELEISDWEITEYGANYWMVGDETSYSGTHSLYIAPYESDYYYIEEESISHFYAKVIVPQTGMYLDFDYLVGGVAREDELKVGIFSEAPDDTESDYTYLETYCCTPTEWNHIRLFISPAYAGEKYLVFTWVNDYSDNSQPPAAIDNISLTLDECTMPLNLVAGEAAVHSVELNWDAVNGAVEYSIAYAAQPYTDWDTISIPSFNATPYNLTGLASLTNYQVMIASVCSSGDTSVFTEPVTFSTPPSCLPSHTPGIVEVTDETALINWFSATGGTLEYEIRYAGRDLNWATEHTSDTFYLLQALSPGDYYTVVIRQDCGEGDYSEPIEISFHTPCLNQIRSLPFTEGFESNIFPPQCWTYTKISGSSDKMQWRDTTFAYSGNGAAYFNSYDLPDGSSSLLITPLVDLTSSKTKVLSFYMYRDGDRVEMTEEGITVLFNDVPEITNAEELIHISRVYYYEPDEDDEGWYQYQVELPASVSPSGYILFQGIGQYGNNVYLDEVKIDTVSFVEKEIEATICAGSSYDFNGNLLEESGIYRDTIFTAPAADTILILTLTVRPEIEYNIYDTICSGESYPFADTSYTDPGTYRHVFTEGVECDSTVILHLAVDSVPEVPVITMETVNDEIWLSSTEGEGISWYRDNVDLQETALRIRVTEQGTYHATFANDCGESAPSNRIVIENINIRDYESSGLSVYPNPASSYVKISGDSKLIDRVDFYAMDGRRVLQQSVNAHRAEINIASLPDGLYIVRILNGDQFSYVKVQVIR